MKDFNRSLEGRKNSSHFWESDNEIDIYIEDKGYLSRKAYLNILQRIFEDYYRIEEIFPLGGRIEVESHHQKLMNDSSRTRPFLCITDGDFTLFFNESLSKKGLFVLPYYCVENVLCDYEALCKLFCHNKVIDLATIKRRFDYLSWYKKSIDLLFDLFVIYALCHKYRTGCKVVKYNINHLLHTKETKPYIRKALISKRVRDLRKKLEEQLDASIIDDEIRTLKKKPQITGIDKMDFISGKDYIFPLLKRYTKNAVNIPFTETDFYIKVSKWCNIERLKICKNFIFNDKKKDKKVDV